MSTSINSSASLASWLASDPSTDGVLTSNFTIDANTWSLPVGVIGAGRTLDGAGFTITYSFNTSGRTDFPGLLKLNGGTVKKLKITGSTSGTNYLQPVQGSSYLCAGITGATGTVERVWLDGCIANRMCPVVYDVGHTGCGGLVGSNSAHTITNCRIGRAFNAPATQLYHIGTNNSGGIAGPGFYGTVSACYVLATTGLGSTSVSNSGAICGPDAGSSGLAIVSDSFVYSAFSATSLNVPSNFGLVASSNVQNVTVQNCFFYATGGNTSLTVSSSFGVFGEVATSNCVVEDSIYFQTLAASWVGKSVGAVSSGCSVTVTNFAANLAYVSGAGSANSTNSITTYTTTLSPLTGEPLASFSPNKWYKGSTPPLPLELVQSPWSWTSLAYTTVPSLSFQKSVNKITWSPPSTSFVCNVALSASLLNASTTSGTAGTYTYSPTAGSFLLPGTRSVVVTFNPTDTTNYEKSYGNIILTITPVLITNQTELKSWVENPIGTGQLQNDITIDVVTWGTPTYGTISANRIFDGNNKTITLSNTSGSEKKCSALFLLNGGTIQNFKLTSSGTGTIATRIRPDITSSFITDSPGDGVARTGTITNIHIDGCRANGLSTWNPTINIGPYYNFSGVVCADNHRYTISNCVVGRSKTDPYVIEHGQWNGNCGIFGAQTCIVSSITKCVVYYETTGTTDYGGVFGRNWGSSSYNVSASELIVYWKCGSRTQYAGAFAQSINGNCSLTNSYLIVDWNITNTTFKQAFAFGSNPGWTASFQNLYVVLNLVGTNTISENYKPYFLSNAGATFTRVAIPSNCTFDSAVSSSHTLTNCSNTYTTSTPNTDEPITSFPVAQWNKAYTPPLLNFNSTGLWDSTLTSYDTPNELSAFSVAPVSGGGGGVSGDGGGDGGGGGGGSVICYGRGTMIEMGDGSVKTIEEVRVGDSVKTDCPRGSRTVTKTYSGSFHNNPSIWYRCMFRDRESGLVVTGPHRICTERITSWQRRVYDKTGLPIHVMNDKFMIHSAVALDRFEQVKHNLLTPIYHFALSDDPEEIYGIWANGVLTESVPKRIIDEEERQQQQQQQQVVQHEQHEQHEISSH